MPAHRLTPHVIATEAQLRALIGAPAELTCAKITRQRTRRALQPPRRLLLIHRRAGFY